MSTDQDKLLKIKSLVSGPVAHVSDEGAARMLNDIRTVVTDE